MTAASPARADASGPATRRDINAYLIPDVAQGNPYLSLLAAGLQANHVRTSVRRSISDALLARIARRAQQRPQVVHLHWVTSLVLKDDPTASIAATASLAKQLFRLRRQGTRIVWTVHALHHDGFWERLAQIVLARACDSLIVHSDAAAGAASRFLRSPRERFSVVPHGHLGSAYPNEVSREEAQRRLGVEHAGPVFLFLGRLRDFKGLACLFEAFGALDDPSAALLVAGEARDAGATQLVAARAARDARIHAQIGFVPDDAVQLYMNAADAVVLPFEGGITSGSVVLAMSFGKAVIASNAPALAGVPAERGAIVFDAGDTAGLARALRAATGADLSSMGRANLERARAWDWETIGRQTRAVYER